MNATLTVKSQEALEERETTVIATTAEQMQTAQLILIDRCNVRLHNCEVELGELQHNLRVAKQNKLRQTGISTAISRTKRRVTFYTKLRAAFEAGYTLIPDMDVEVFAIRTTAAGPVEHYDVNKSSYSGVSVPSLPDQQSNLAPLGEGRYVSPQALEVHGEPVESTDKDGKLVYSCDAWAEDFQEEIVFPFALAKPQIVEMTTRAMALKVFDDFGVLPRTRRSDPMVVGRILLGRGWQQKRMNFLVCWFVETRTL